MSSTVFNYGYICITLLLLFDCRCWSWSDADCPTGFKFATANSGTKFTTNGVTKGWTARGNNGRWVLTPFTHMMRTEGKIKCGEAMSKVSDSGTKICCYSSRDTANEFDVLSASAAWKTSNPATMPFRYTYRRGNTLDGYTYTVLENPQNVVKCQAGSDEGGVFPERGFKSSLSCQRTGEDIVPASIKSRTSWTTCGNGGGRCTNIERSNEMRWFRFGNADTWVYGAILIEPDVASSKNWVFCGRQTLGGFNPNQDAANVCQIAEIGSPQPTTEEPEPTEEPNAALYARLSRKFAPIINLFPYDTNRPSSVEQFFDLVDLRAKIDESLITTEVTGDIIGDDAYRGDDYYLDFKKAAPTGEDVYMTGKLADADGFVDAPLYCHITELSKEYRITYALFYPFNGFQTFRVNYKSGLFSDHTRNIEWSKFARHVGDWEHAHIFVSKDTEEMVKVHASQHGDEELGYPSEIEVEGTRTVLYSAWNSHAFYYKEKTQTLEDLGYQWALSAFTAVNWLKVIDTTASGQKVDKYMLATDYNSNGVKVDVIRNDNLILITDENESDFPWLNFDGSWGAPKMDNAEIDNPPDIEGSIEHTLMDILSLVPESAYDKYLTSGGARGPKTRDWWANADVTHDGCPSGYILGTDDNGSKFNPVPINEGWIARGAHGRWILTPFTDFMQSTGKVACGESLSKPGDDVDKICCISYENTATDYAPRDWIETDRVSDSMGLSHYEYRRGSTEEGMTYAIIENPVNVPQCNAGSDEGGVFPHRGFAIRDSMICEVTQTDAQLPSDLLSVGSGDWMQCGTQASGRCENIPPSAIPRWFRYGSDGHWMYSKILIDVTVAADHNWLHCSRKTLGGYNPFQNGNNICEYALLDGETQPNSAHGAADLDRVSDGSDLTNGNDKASSNTTLGVVIALCLFCCIFGMGMMYLYQKRKWIYSDNNNNDTKRGSLQKYSTTATHDQDVDEEDEDNDEGDSNV